VIKYGQSAREVRKVPLFGMGDSIDSSALRRTDIFVYRSKSIILFEALNKLGGELTKLVQLRDAGVLTEKEF